MKNVLLVDDDQIASLLTTKEIEKLGFVGGVHSALNGQDALRLINEYYLGSLGLPDFILLDLNMPIMDGFGFISAFRKLSIPGIERVKIIIVTSSNNPKDIAKAKDLGIQHFLTKPINKIELNWVLHH